jgi:hypothetical protein
MSWRIGLPVLQMILGRLEVSVEPTLGAMLVAMMVGVPLGIRSAQREDRPMNHLARVASLFGLSMVSKKEGGHTCVVSRKPTGVQFGFTLVVLECPCSTVLQTA